MLKLAKLLHESGISSNVNFVHIILTDGSDNRSKSDLGTALSMMQSIGKQINVKMLKIIIIGVGVERET